MPSTVPAHDIHFHLNDEEWAAVSAVARRARMPVTAAVRQLVARGLDREAADPTPRPRDIRRLAAAVELRPADRELLMAALVAAEHTLAVLKHLMPRGEAVAAELEDAAGAAAQRRLQRLAAANGRGGGSGEDSGGDEAGG